MGKSVGFYGAKLLYCSIYRGNTTVTVTVTTGFSTVSIIVRLQFVDFQVADRLTEQ